MQYTSAASLWHLDLVVNPRITERAGGEKRQGIYREMGLDKSQSYTTTCKMQISSQLSRYQIQSPGSIIYWQ